MSLRRVAHVQQAEDAVILRLRYGGQVSSREDDGEGSGILHETAANRKIDTMTPSICWTPKLGPFGFGALFDLQRESPCLARTRTLSKKLSKIINSRIIHRTFEVCLSLIPEPSASLNENIMLRTACEIMSTHALVPFAELDTS